MNAFKTPELLAPAGKIDVLKAVITVGADAVYVSGKKFNMRRHRKDFHFSDEELCYCCDYVHERDKKIYVVVNSLIGDQEINELTDFLYFLQDIHIDALIVQDMAVAAICKENGINIPLHASTMMNINNTASACFLKSAGFVRAVTSRDITIDQVKKIREESFIEMEYFIHGDMCSVQSGQCISSGLMFGKSANRGQCLKMCRWAYDLVADTSGHTMKHNAYLLAAKDMCVIQHIPEFIQAGIDSFKIEGRMKPQDILIPIIKSYRTQIDTYLSNPLAYTRNYEVSRQIHDNRMRNMSTGFSFGHPSGSYMDITGEREPIFLSYSGSLQPIEDFYSSPFENNDRKINLPLPELTCLTGSFESALQAIDNGADTVVLSWEGDLRVDSVWTKEKIYELYTKCSEKNKKLALRTPRIITSRELNELYYIVGLLEFIDTYIITSFAPIPFLLSKDKKIWADSPCNIINSKSAQFYFDAGVSRVMPSLEASFDTAKQLIGENKNIPFELLAHGTITGMVLEHCLIAMNLSQSSKQEFCKMPCNYGQYSLRDRLGNLRPIKTDKYCRNHILMEKELTILPALKSFLSLGAKSFRIDAVTYTPEKTAFVVKLWKKAIEEDSLTDHDKQIKLLLSLYDPSALTYGAYLKGVLDDNRKSLYSLKKEESRV